MLSINNNNYNYSERERHVIGLYDQGKSTRDIAKELRMSLRDISSILRKNQVGHGISFPIIDNDSNNNNNNKSPNERSTQAYKLFSEGKKPVEVAIQLGLSERQATKYCREYWELTGLHELTFLYEERRHCLPSFLRLHNIMERQGIDNENDIANVLKYAKELPNLQQYWENLRANNHNLKCQNQDLEKDLQARRRSIAELTEVENMLHQNIDTLQDNIHSLFNERRQLQQFVSRFKNSDSRYLQIKSIAEEHVNRLLTEEETLLDLALNAVIEALRMNPDRYNVIYDSQYEDNCSIFDNGSNIATAKSSSPSNAKPQNHNHYYDQYREGILEIANSLLKILLNQMVDNTMVVVVKEQ
jgi:DNA-binding CsgD family transcriptional regulator/cytidylate kinase